MMENIQILDTTLREGEQTPGISFDNHIKLSIVQLLDEIGIDYIEVGHPAVSEEIYEGVKTISKKKFKSKISAHSRSLRNDVELALSCNVDFIGLFYCVLNDRINNVYKKDLSRVIDQISEIIHFIKSQNPRLIIRFTPEDTFRSEFTNVVQVAKGAVKAGADIISLADTTGYMIPNSERSFYQYIRRFKKALAEENLNPKIAVHCHNDRGLALANALDALRAGIDIIDASVLGLGERAGIVDLALLLTILKVDYKVKNKWQLTHLPALYELVSKHARLPIQLNYPLTGKNAFTHCAGVHSNAALINPVHYQSLDPGIIGRKTEIALDQMSGLSSIRYAIAQLGLDPLDETTTLKVLEKVKKIGHKGRTVAYDELKHIIECI